MLAGFILGLIASYSFSLKDPRSLLITTGIFMSLAHLLKGPSQLLHLLNE